MTLKGRPVWDVDAEGGDRETGIARRHRPEFGGVQGGNIPEEQWVDVAAEHLPSSKALARKGERETTAPDGAWNSVWDDETEEGIRKIGTARVRWCL